MNDRPTDSRADLGSEEGGATAVVSSASVRTVEIDPAAVPPEIVVRADFPEDGCTVFADTVRIHGWFIATPEELRQLRSDARSVSVLLQEDRERSTSLYANMHLAAFAFDRERPSVGDIVLESLSLSESQPGAYGHLPGTSGSPVDIECTLSFRALKFSNRQPRAFQACFRIGLGARTSESNRITFLLQPPENWGLAFGGFSLPLSRRVEATRLLIEGWALRRGDVLERAEIFFDDESLGEAICGLRSVEEEKALPYLVEAERCRFALSVPAEKRGASPTVRLSARCAFRSGETLELAGPQLRWDVASDASLPRGEIETVRLVDEGLIEVAGWFLVPGFTKLSFFLEGRSWRVCVPEVERIERDDIAARFPTLERAAPCGFRFAVHPEILGATPGKVRLTVETAEQRIELGPTTFWEELSRLIAMHTNFRSAGERTKAKVVSAASRLGLRKSFEASRGEASRREATEERELGRLLVATHNLSAVEGAPKVLYQFIRSLCESGFPASGIRVVTPQDGELGEAYESLGVSCNVLRGFELSGTSWEKYHRTLEKLNDLLGDFPPDIVFANVIDSFFAVDFARRRTIPCLWSIHESVDPRRAFPTLDARFRQLFLDCLAGPARLAFVAESTHRIFQPYAGPLPPVVIPNGIDLGRIEQAKRTMSREDARRRLGLGDEVVVTIVGTTTPRKGQDVFLREAARIREQLGRPLRCFIVGARDGEYLEQLKELRQGLSLVETVELVPETMDVAKYYVASDVLVIASREESAPLVSLEAFAYERPLVSTGVFGLSEQLEHEKNALIYSLEEPGALSAAVLRTLQDEPLRRRLVAGGSETLRARFTLERCTAAYERAVRETARGLTARQLKG